MGKVLFISRSEFLNSSVERKMAEKFPVNHSVYNTDIIKNELSTNEYSLLVLYMNHLSAEEEIVASRILAFMRSVPVVIVGDRKVLERYYKKSEAIIKYIKTPLLLSAYIQELNSAYRKVEKINETLNVDLMELEKVPEELKEEKVTELEPPKKILVVDDDVVLLKTISTWLKNLFEVSVAKSADDCMKCLKKQIPDLILLDYEMPVVNGVKTLEYIRDEEAFRDIPVFFLTSVADAGKVEAALKLKPQDYILKGNGMEYLISKIEKFL